MVCRKSLFHSFAVVAHIMYGIVCVDKLEVLIVYRKALLRLLLWCALVMSLNKIMLR